MTIQNRTTFGIIMLAVLGLTVSAQASGKKSGGTLTGKLTVTAPYRKNSTASNSNNASKYGSGTASAPVETHDLPEEVVIYLKKVPGEYDAPKKHVRLDQSFLQFTNRVLPVLKGTTVDFTNHDPVYHNVFTNSQINPFDLGRKGKGEMVSVKMNHVEIPVKVYCEIHPKMKAYILVLGNPFFTTVSPDQTYEIDGIPSGTYTMVTWHDFWAPVEKQVKIKKGKTTVANITLDQVQE